MGQYLNRDCGMEERSSTPRSMGWYFVGGVWFRWKGGKEKGRLCMIGLYSRTCHLLYLVHAEDNVLFERASRGMTRVRFSWFGCDPLPKVSEQLSLACMVNKCSAKFWTLGRWLNSDMRRTLDTCLATPQSLIFSHTSSFSFTTTIVNYSSSLVLFTYYKIRYFQQYHRA